MRQAISLHMGLNRVDRAHYGAVPELFGCINDAKAMAAIARDRGFQTTVRLDAQATSEALYEYLIDAAKTLRSGDTLLVTFAGHGSQVDDENNDEESGLLDQTWCLYDRFVVDDELAELWALFQAGVRIVLVSDSCHSEGVARALQILSEGRSRSVDRGLVRELEDLAVPIGDVDDDAGTIRGYRTLSRDVRERIVSRHADLYSSIQQQTRGSEKVKIRASVLTLAACRNDELAGDGDNHGLYTSKLLSVWNKGAFRGNYRAFQDEIAVAVGSPRQHPRLKLEGARNAALEAELPFSNGIAPPPRPSEKDTTYVSSTNGDVNVKIPAHLIAAAVDKGKQLLVSVGYTPE